MIAVLGSGGVGGLLAGVLERASEPLMLVAREESASLLERDGLVVESEAFGDFSARPRVVTEVEEPVDVLFIATKASGLEPALGRVHVTPNLIVPLLNGVEHLAFLRERYGSRAIAASIRVQSDRPRTGRIRHSGVATRIELASADPARAEAVESLAEVLRHVGIEVAVLASEAEVMWGKLARLCPLACATSASGETLGWIRDDPVWRERLEGGVRETVAIAGAEGAEIQVARILAELEALGSDSTSSMARDIAEGRPPELDAIAGAVLRCGARHAIAAPTIEWLRTRAAERARTATDSR